MTDKEFNSLRRLEYPIYVSITGAPDPKVDHILRIIGIDKRDPVIHYDIHMVNKARRETILIFYFDRPETTSVGHTIPNMTELTAQEAKKMSLELLFR